MELYDIKRSDRLESVKVKPLELRYRKTNNVERFIESKKKG